MSVYRTIGPLVKQILFTEDKLHVLNKNTFILNRPKHLSCVFPVSVRPCDSMGHQLDGLLNLWERSQVPAPTGINLQRTWNVKQWLIPCLDSMERHSKPHCFKMVRNEDGMVEIFWKKWATDKVSFTKLYRTSRHYLFTFRNLPKATALANG